MNLKVSIFSTFSIYRTRIYLRVDGAVRSKGDEDYREICMGGIRGV